MPRPPVPHRIWAEIDLDALGHNLGRIARAAGPSVATLLVVKADASGHGALPVARRAAGRAAGLGVGAFGVGTVGEALELRAAEVPGRLIVLGAIVDEEAEPALRHGVELGLHSLDRARRLDRLARRLGVRARVHVNVDTGMGRLGVGPDRAPALLALVERCRGLELAGLMTHVAATAGLRDPAGRAQLERFRGVVRDALAAGHRPGWVHAVNSACLFTGSPPERFGDAVRAGIAAYGMLEIPGGEPTGLRPVLALRTQVIFFKDVPAGAAVGYGGEWIAPRRSRVATLPAGYHDGVPWRAGNSGRALVRGREVPIVGRVSMDYTTIDVTDVPGVGVGDVVTLVGRDGERAIAAADLARAAGTIPYEITCSIGARVPRVVLGPGADVRPADAPRAAAGSAP